MICLAFGNRPDYLKFLPLLKYWKEQNITNYCIYLTGQHEELCNKLKEELQEYSSDVYVDTIQNIVNDRLNNLVISISKFFSLYLHTRPEVTHIMCLGDTASAFACALVAFSRKIPIIHLEAGLRSYNNDNPYPEEFYRRSISMMASTNLCPTVDNKLALIEERVPGTRFVVGNTVLDSIKDIVPTKTDTVICTLHRRENLEKIEEWFSSLDSLAKKNPKYTFMLLIHPNPAISKYKDTFKYVKCVDALNHEEFTKALASCAAVISDSGGVAEEASWFKKPIFLCRKHTERPEAEDFYIWIYEPEDLLSANIEFHSNDPFFAEQECPFGDGNASEKITNVLKKVGIITV